MNVVHVVEIQVVSLLFIVVINVNLCSAVNVHLKVFTERHYVQVLVLIIVITRKESVLYDHDYNDQQIYDCRSDFCQYVDRILMSIPLLILKTKLRL